MPITILDPQPGSLFGPGFRMHWETDLVGPIPIDWHWQITWINGDPGSEATVESSLPIHSSHQHEIDQTYLVEPNIVSLRPDSRIPATSGRFRIRLQDPTDLVVEEAEVAIVPDMQTGVLYQLSQRTTGGGLTTTQAQQLETTTAAMGFAIGGGWTDLAGNLLEAVGRRFFSTELIEPNRTGEGRLTRPGPLGGVNANGIQWHVFDLAPGIGLDEGVPDRTEINHQQLSLMRDTNIGLVAHDSRYIDAVNGRWVWGWDFPEAVDYFIMPGVTVTYWWVLFAIGGTGELLEELDGPHELVRPADSQ